MSHICHKALSVQKIPDELIGRKYPRRHRTRPRKTIEIPDDIPEQVSRAKLETQELETELASAQADMVFAKATAHNGVNRKKHIAELSQTIGILENNLRIASEEEFLLMMLITAQLH